MATRVRFIRIMKCKDVPVDSSNDFYRLKTGSIKENHYLIVPKDCGIYVQKQENEAVTFKTIKKVHEQDMPMSTSTCKICCCIS